MAKFNFFAVLVLVLGMVLYFPAWKNTKVTWFGQVCLSIGLGFTTYFLGHTALL